MNLMAILMEVNWTNISSNWLEYAVSGYEYVFSNWVYPIIFMGIIGYVYAVNKSAMSAAAAICLIFGIFGGAAVLIHPDIQQFREFGSVIAVVAFSALFVTIIVSKYRGS